jgi:Bacterial regulatory proteins, tetR family
MDIHGCVQMTGNKDNLNVKKEKKTKERIFDVAINLFAQNGFNATSMREIAEVVGIKKASMYSHFNSKDEILEKIIDYPMARIGIVGPQGVETEELIVSMGPENFMIMAIGVVTDWMKDPSMEKIWRIICIELYHNEQIKRFYSQFVENAFSFWKSNFDIMNKHKLIKPSDPEILAREYLQFYGNAYMDYFILRYGNTSKSFIQEYHDSLIQHTEFIVNSIKL